jgi:sulfur-carrier protein adenylyltransferase/sulfurtransferase
MKLNQNEIDRYNRQIRLNKFGIKAQEKLKNASVLIVGAGALGVPLLQYLTAAGLGKIGVIDNDYVEISNLHRQVLYSENDEGIYKVDAAINKLSQLNSHVMFKGFKERLDKSNALTILKEYDIIVDGSDNFATKYLINDACIILNKPFVFGAIQGFEGQLSVFNYESGPSYRCLFPESPKAQFTANCSELGVIGVVPSIIASYQANEVIKMITGIGNILSSKLMLINCLTNQNQVIKINKNEDNFKIKVLGNYQITCQVNNEIDVRVLDEKIKDNKDIYLLDVREKDEWEICRFENAKLIPMLQIPNKYKLIPKDKEVIIYCHHGIRSRQITELLLNEYHFTNVYNLKGGIDDWAQKIDTTMKRY